MSKFIRIVKNYEKICRIGNQIISHKDFVRRAPPEKLNEEFRKQEKRIEDFIEVTNKADKEWKKHHNSINSYWTGLS